MLKTRVIFHKIRRFYFPLHPNSKLWPHSQIHSFAIMKTVNKVLFCNTSEVTIFKFFGVNPCALAKYLLTYHQDLWGISAFFSNSFFHKFEVCWIKVWIWSQKPISREIISFFLIIIQFVWPTSKLQRSSISSVSIDIYLVPVVIYVLHK